MTGIFGDNGDGELISGIVAILRITPAPDAPRPDCCENVTETDAAGGC